MGEAVVLIVVMRDKAGLQPVGLDELKVSPPSRGAGPGCLRTVLTGIGLRDTSPRRQSIGYDALS